MSQQLKQELDAKLDEALNQESHDNERVVSWIRVMVLTLTNLIGLVAHPRMIDANWWESQQGLMMLLWLAASVVIVARYGRISISQGSLRASIEKPAQRRRAHRASAAWFRWVAWHADLRRGAFSN